MSSVYMDRASYETLDAAGVKRLIDRHMLVDEGKYRQLQEYYLGNHSILHSHKEHSASPNNRIVCNVAKYITDTFYISQSTAKTHIYNIYRKFGIHSRQELLDFIEDIEVPADEEASGGLSEQVSASSAL